MSICSSIRAITRPQWSILIAVALANIWSAITFSCYDPFYPPEATRAGLSTAQIGLLLGAPQLVIAFSSTFLGKMVPLFGSKRLFIFGLSICSAGILMFGCLAFIQDAKVFFGTTFFSRVLTCFGFGAFTVASMALLAQSFMDNLAFVVGVMQAIQAISYAIGPIIGAILYHLGGGIKAPFIAFGFSMLISALISCCFLSVPSELNNTIDEENGGEIVLESSTSSPFGLLELSKMPEVWLSLLGVTTLQLCVCFYDAFLVDHVKQLNSSAYLVNALISVMAAMRMVSAPIWGLLADRIQSCAWAIMVSGSMMAMLFAVLIGPTPLLALIKLNLPLSFMAFVLLGLAYTAILTPALKYCIRATMKRRYCDDISTTSASISGMIQTSIFIGEFLGDTFGGLSVQLIGFEWTGTLAALAQIPFIFGMISFWISTKCKEQSCQTKQDETTLQQHQSVDPPEADISRFEHL